MTRKKKLNMFNTQLYFPEYFQSRIEAKTKDIKKLHWEKISITIGSKNSLDLHSVYVSVGAKIHAEAPPDG